MITWLIYNSQYFASISIFFQCSFLRIVWHMMCVTNLRRILTTVHPIALRDIHSHWVSSTVIFSNSWSKNVPICSRVRNFDCPWVTSIFARFLSSALFAVAFIRESKRNLGGNNKLCCTRRQLDALFKGMSLPNSILQRCPACLDNFWKNWCEYTCSPNQADFVKVSQSLSLATFYCAYGLSLLLCSRIKTRFLETLSYRTILCVNQTAYTVMTWSHGAT